MLLQDGNTTKMEPLELENFTSGDGRAIKLASTGDIAFTGTINTSDVNISITDATGSGGNAFNLVGNPYPSFIAANNNADATNNILKSKMIQIMDYLFRVNIMVFGIKAPILMIK